ncbi:MAG: hypothetical protein ACE5ID_10395, partial [Acidobacteriota bacterium]
MRSSPGGESRPAALGLRGRPAGWRAGYLAAALLLAGSAGCAGDAGSVTGGRAAGPAASGDPPATIAFLVVDGVYNTELTAPLDVLQHVRFHLKAGWPQTFLVSPDGE